MARRKPEIETPRDTTERVAALLAAADRSGEIPDEIVDSPGKFLREFYETWYQNGDLEGGKPRNSIRRMRDEWLTGEQTVRSLHPKLKGQVKLGRRDGQRLIDLFLSRWEYVGSRRKDDAVTEDGYVPFPSTDISALRNTLVDAIFGLDSTVVLLPKLEKDIEPEEDAVTQSVRSYKSLIQESDALITVSSRQSVLGPSASEGMRLWWHLVEDMATHDVYNEKVFIWIIDLGSRQVEDEGAFAEYCNAGLLALHFASFGNFISAHDQDAEDHGPVSRRLSLPNDENRLKRWEWLKSHAVVVVRTRGHSALSRLYEEEDRSLEATRIQQGTGLDASDALPRIVPSAWARSLSDFYRQPIQDLADATLTVAIKKEGWAKNDLRYLAATSRVKYIPDFDDVDQEAWSVDITELPSPGSHNDEMYRFVYFGALHRLSQGNASNRDQMLALAFLKSIGFEIIKIDDFIAIFGRIERDIN